MPFSDQSAFGEIDENDSSNDSSINRRRKDRKYRIHVGMHETGMPEHEKKYWLNKYLKEADKGIVEPDKELWVFEEIDQDYPLGAKGAITMQVENHMKYPIVLYYYSKGKPNKKSKFTINPGMRQEVFTYHGTKWRIEKSDDNEYYSEWIMNKNKGGLQIYRVKREYVGVKIGRLGSEVIRNLPIVNIEELEKYKDYDCQNGRFLPYGYENSTAMLMNSDCQQGKVRLKRVGKIDKHSGKTYSVLSRIHEFPHGVSAQTRLTPEQREWFKPKPNPGPKLSGGQLRDHRFKFSDYFKNRKVNVQIGVNEYEVDLSKVDLVVAGMCVELVNGGRFRVSHIPEDSTAPYYRQRGYNTGNTKIITLELPDNQLMKGKIEVTRNDIKCARVSEFHEQNAPFKKEGKSKKSKMKSIKKFASKISPFNKKKRRTKGGGKKGKTKRSIRKSGKKKKIS